MLKIQNTFKTKKPVWIFLVFLFSSFQFAFAKNGMKQSQTYLRIDDKNSKIGVAQFDLKLVDGNYQTHFFLWSPQNPSKNYRNMSDFSSDSLLMIRSFISNYLSEEYLQESYQRSTREWIAKSTRMDKLLTLNKSPIFTEDQLLVLVPFLFENGINKFDFWLQTTLSPKEIRSRDPEFSEIIITDQRLKVKDVECVLVKWIYKEKEYLIFVSTIGWPKVIQMNFPDLSRLELHKIELMP